MHTNFTKRTIENWQLTPGKVIYHYDTKTRGLALRISKGGLKTFIFYRWLWELVIGFKIAVFVIIAITGIWL